MQLYDLDQESEAKNASCMTEVFECWLALSRIAFQHFDHGDVV